MKDTNIRWCEHTFNPVTGCTKISPGCDHCYAETMTIKFGARTFPNGFVPTFKPQKLSEPTKYKLPARVFVNSMSDLHHVDFTDAQRDAIYDVMLAESRHDYLVLTKRPQLMASYFTGPDGYLARRALEAAPANIWLGCSIESDKYTFRTRHLTSIPAFVHFLSLEPLLGPLPSLDLTDIDWVIVGGESGPGYRPMDEEWVADIVERADAAGIATFYKQGAAPRTEMYMEFRGRRIEEYPLEHPADRRRNEHPPFIGRWTGRHGSDDTAVTVRPAPGQGELL